jgi:hypothetical protein
MYALIANATSNGIVPHAYVHKLLARISVQRVNWVANLLLWNVADELSSGSIGTDYLTSTGRISAPVWCALPMSFRTATSPAKVIFLA